MLVEGAIVLVVSRFYHKKASEDLRQEAESIRRLVEDVQRDTQAIRHYAYGLVAYLEEAGLIKPRRDQG